MSCGAVGYQQVRKVQGQDSEEKTCPLGLVQLWRMQVRRWSKVHYALCIMHCALFTLDLIFPTCRALSILKKYRRAQTWDRLGNEPLIYPLLP